MNLSKQDFALGAIHRMVVRRGLTKNCAAALLENRAGFPAASARSLAEQWFSQQYRHGLHWQRERYIAGLVL